MKHKQGRIMNDDNFVQVKKLTSTEKLYGIDPKIFIGMSYERVAMLKIRAAKKVISDINDEPMIIYAPELDEFGNKVIIGGRDMSRQNTALKAVKYNEDILSEMGLL